MCSVTSEECHRIMTSYLDHANFNIKDYCLAKATEATVGLMSTVSLLKVKYTINDDPKTTLEVSFFIKFLPQNKFHLDCVTRACVYKKEAAFFGTLFSDMRKFLIYKSLPTCHLKDCETKIVLENLAVDGYKTNGNNDGFDLTHTKIALKALADVHAASLLYEHQVGQPLDKIFTYEILRPWFTEIENYPGYNDNLTAAGVISAVLDKYFTHFPKEIIDKAKEYCYKFSQNMQMSKKYQNVITHQDLWRNNIMFQYDKGEVKNAVIIDYQMYGYNPPSLDALMVIYCNADKQTRDKHMDEMLEYYFDCLTNNLVKHNVKPDEIITKDEFIASFEETLPPALTSAPLYLQTVLIPEEELNSVLNDEDKFKHFMENDRSVSLEMMEKHDHYKKRVLIATEDLLNYLTKNSS